MKLRCEKLAPHKRFAVRNADPHVRKRLSPKFYQLRRNQRSPPIIGQRPVTFVLDSVVYWRFSLGMEAWIKTGAVLEEFRAVRIPNFVDHCASGAYPIAPCRFIRVHCRRVFPTVRGAVKG